MFGQFFDETGYSEDEGFSYDPYADPGTGYASTQDFGFSESADPDAYGYGDEFAYPEETLGFPETAFPPVYEEPTFDVGVDLYGYGEGGGDVFDPYGYEDVSVYEDPFAYETDYDPYDPSLDEPEAFAYETDYDPYDPYLEEPDLYGYSEEQVDAFDPYAREEFVTEGSVPFYADPRVYRTATTTAVAISRAVQESGGDPTDPVVREQVRRAIAGQPPVAATNAQNAQAQRAAARVTATRRATATQGSALGGKALPLLLGAGALLLLMGKKGIR